ncbi:hypothetical protein ABIE26_004050 [Pedobacter africanus]
MVTEMKKTIFSMICLAMALLVQSCSEENINAVPANFPQASSIYGNKVTVLQFINNLYTFVPRGYNRMDVNPGSNDEISGAAGATPGVPAPGAFTAMLASATDEAVHATRNSAAERWGAGQWNSSAANLWDSPYRTMYAGIRRTFNYTEDIGPNLIIGNGANELKAAERDQYHGQVIFLRALFNFELLKRFGGYPIVKKQLSAADDMNIPKSSYADCVKYITELCNEAAPLLPLVYPTSTSDFGRATRGAALALKARLLLYAASPLNNTAADVTKWEAAAQAAAAVINLKDGAANVYGLYPAGTSGAGYEAFFTTIAGNNEIIFSKMEPANNTIERLNGLPSISGGLGGTCPTLDLVNDYEMVTGVPFDWNNPAHAANPFANRDPRFGKSIIFNGATWMNSGTSALVETFEGGKDKVGTNPTRTGFYLRKFLNVNARWVAPTGNTNHCFPLFRYAEVLLNYAEAMNEAYGPDNAATYGLTARQAIALIRTRAGLTGNLTVPQATTQALMRSAIRHERRIELAFEEHRHMDLRRWKIAESVLNQPVSGLKILKTGATTYSYTPEVVEPRVFTSKMYYYPFPQEELSRNPGLVQNTGW